MTTRKAKGITARLRAARKRRSDAELNRSRSLVFARDGCACRWCKHPVAVSSVYPAAMGQVHHIRYRSQGGSHDPSNLVLLCAGCHDAVHAKRLIVTGNANAELEFTEVRP